MSLKDRFPEEIPEETRAAVEPLLPAESVYRLIGQEGDKIVREEEFAPLYSKEGRPGINPVVLTLVTVFQYLEGLTDRRAAEMARLRLDWKYALRQNVNWPGFNFSDLSNFRKRVMRNEQEKMIFEQVINYLQEQGYLKSKGKQRTDATHIIGNVMRLSRLELVWETLRLAVSALISADARWSLYHLPATFVEKHTKRQSQYHLSDTKVKQEMQQAGGDGYWLLKRVEEQGNHLVNLPEIETLKRVLEEQFSPPEGDNLPKARPDKDCSGDVIATPHDQDVRYGSKGTRSWHGYKLQVTETADDEQSFVTDIDVTSTLETDNQALPDIQQRLEARQLLPAQQYGDQGYVNGGTIETSWQHYQIDLRGYVSSGNSSKPEGFRLMDFEVNVQQHRAICPAGREAVRWKPASSTHRQRKRIAYRVWFGTGCRDCLFFTKDFCTTDRRGRALDISPYHDTLQARRREMHSQQFADEMQARNAIEGTISELVRAHGIRRSRYRGIAKNRLQAYFTAVAINLKRLAKARHLLFFLRFWAFARPAVKNPA